MSEAKSAGESKVRVVVRIRPFLPKEIAAKEIACVTVNKGDGCNTVNFREKMENSFGEVAHTDTAYQYAAHFCLRFALVCMGFGRVDSMHVTMKRLIKRPFLSVKSSQHLHIVSLRAARLFSVME